MKKNQFYQNAQIFSRVIIRRIIIVKNPGIYVVVKILNEGIIYGIEF